MYNHYNLIQVYFKYLFDNIRDFYLYHLNKLIDEELYDISSEFKPKFRDKLYDIKSYIHKFYPYRNRNIFYVLNNIKTIKRIKDETLEKLRKELIEINPDQTDYINKIKKKLEDHYSDDFHSYHLNNIHELAPIVNAPTNLINLREILRDIRNDIVYFKKEISQIKFLSSYRFLIAYAKSKYSGQKGFESLMKSFEKDETLYTHFFYTIKKIDYLIGEINLIIEYIPNVIPKLKKAKSILDKRKYIEHLLDLLKFESMDNIRGISQFISSNRKSIPTYILSKITLNRRIIIELFIVKKLMNNKNPVDIIKQSITESLSIINKFKSIDEYINQLKGINSELNVKNINVNIQNVRLIIKDLEKVLNKTDVNIVSELKELIDILEYIKKSMRKRKIYENNGYSQVNLQNLYNIIGILNLIKSLIEKLMCFKEKLESTLKSVESSVSELECAIEGVARNLIRCSLQSASNSIVTEINDNNINKDVKVNKDNNNNERGVKLF